MDWIFSDLSGPETYPCRANLAGRGTRSVVFKIQITLRALRDHLWITDDPGRQTNHSIAQIAKALLSSSYRRVGR